MRVHRLIVWMCVGLVFLPAVPGNAESGTDALDGAWEGFIAETPDAEQRELRGARG